MAADSPRSGRTWLVALVALMSCALVGASAWLPFALRSPVPISSSENPTMPRGLGTVPLWTADAQRSPAGPAVALVETTGFFSDGYLAVGAYANRIRSVAGITERGDVDSIYSTRLSPDGRQVAVGGESPDGDSGVVLVDLTTGATRGFDTRAGYVDVLAWSPDGHLVAYADRDTGVELLDTRTGQSRHLDVEVPALTDGGPYPEHADVVAFSPDGERIAVDVGDAVRLVPLGGGASTEVPKEYDQVLAGPAAWSPDGRLIALYHEEYIIDDVLHATLAFLPLDGRSASGTGSPRPSIAFPGAFMFDLVGWMSPSEPVTAEVGIEDAHIVVQRLDGGERRTMMTLGADVYRIELAAGLLPGIGTRGRRHDAGPAPAWALPALSMAAALVSYCGAGVVAALGVLVAAPGRRRGVQRIDPPPHHAASSIWQRPD